MKVDNQYFPEADYKRASDVEHYVANWIRNIPINGYNCIEVEFIGKGAGTDKKINGFKGSGRNDIALKGCITGEIEIQGCKMDVSQYTLDLPERKIKSLTSAIKSGNITSLVGFIQPMKYKDTYKLRGLILNDHLTAIHSDNFLSDVNIENKSFGKSKLNSETGEKILAVTPSYIIPANNVVIYDERQLRCTIQKWYETGRTTTCTCNCGNNIFKL